MSESAEITQAGVTRARVTRAGVTPNPFRQPKAVWAVAFACVISFMGIGLEGYYRPVAAM